MKLCISLDFEKSENLALLKNKNFDIWLKVGFRTYLRDGKSFRRNKSY